MGDTIFLDDACRYTTQDKQEDIEVYKYIGIHSMVGSQTSVGVSSNTNYPWLGDVLIIFICDLLFISNIVHQSRITFHLSCYVLPTHKLLNFHERTFIIMINDISLMRFYLLFQQEYWLYRIV